VGKIVKELTLISDGVVAVDYGSISLLFAVLVFTFVSEAVAKIVHSSAMFLAIPELPLIDTVGLF
jgi:hypothetical protein